ncbi:MAG: 50S ribosomal protein L23 [Gammaproteobacteria bacterium]|nr:50S ribosomal protein L23 [Gammaproteobacteria bacterium]
MKNEKLIKLIKAPHVSEKATNAAESNNQIVLKVEKDATKKEIKEAVELMFDTKVDKVRVCNMKAKRKMRVRGQEGRRPGWKKAYVSLAEGQNIDFMSAE